MGHAWTLIIELSIGSVVRRKEVPIWSQSIYLTGQQYNRVGRWFSPSIHDLTVTFFYKYRCLSSSGCIISLKLTKLPITLIWFWAPDHPYSKKRYFPSSLNRPSTYPAIEPLEHQKLECNPVSKDKRYRSGTVNSKSFVGKVLLRIKWLAPSM